MPETQPVAPSPIVPDPAQKPLFGDVLLPPACTRAERDKGDTIINGIVSRLSKLPPVLIDLVMREACSPEQFHKAEVAARYIHREFAGVKNEKVAAWILSSAALELQPVEDNGEAAPE